MGEGVLPEACVNTGPSHTPLGWEMHRVGSAQRPSSVELGPIVLAFLNIMDRVSCGSCPGQLNSQLF